MAFAVVQHTQAQNTSQNSGATTPGIDTTGADLIVVATAYYADHASTYLSDSKTNTWTYLTVESNGNGGRVQIAYCYNPTVGSGHTFTISTALDYASLTVIALLGSAASPFDQENGGHANDVTTQATGSVTPSEDNEILITIANVADGGAKTIDLGFTIIESIAYNNGNAFGQHLAYLIQTTTASKNPTWSNVSSEPYSATRIATFKAAVGAGAVFPAGIINTPIGI